MQLTVRDVASLLNVSEKTIYRWIHDGRLPAYRMKDQYRFNRAELLEWTTAHKVNVSPQIFSEPETAGGQRQPTLEEALRAGGICYRVEGGDKPSVLRSVVDLLPVPEQVDRKFLYEVLMARESLGSTGIGDGVAIPHVRNPIVLHVSRPMITLCFLERSVQFDAVDGKPVHTLFTILSPTIRGHLHILSRLVYLLRVPSFAEVLAKHGSREEILDECRRAESCVEQKTDAPSPETPRAAESRVGEGLIP